MSERRSLWELNSEERTLLFRSLLEIDHHDPDYSDVRVGDIVTAQRIANADWMWEPRLLGESFRKEPGRRDVSRTMD